MSTEFRAWLEQEEAAYLQALLADGSLPDGLDAVAAACTGESLFRKRLRAVIRTHGELHERIGKDEFESQFRAYCRLNPSIVVGCGADGQAFFAHLTRQERSRKKQVRLTALTSALKRLFGSVRFRDGES